jgi:hypothetical protein
MKRSKLIILLFILILILLPIIYIFNNTYKRRIVERFACDETTINANIVDSDCGSFVTIHGVGTSTSGRVTSGGGISGGVTSGGGTISEFSTLMKNYSSSDIYNITKNGKCFGAIKTRNNYEFKYGNCSGTNNIGLPNFQFIKVGENGNYKLRIQNSRDDPKKEDKCMAYNASGGLTFPVCNDHKSNYWNIYQSSSDRNKYKISTQNSFLQSGNSFSLNSTNPNRVKLCLYFDNKNPSSAIKNIGLYNCNTSGISLGIIKK